MTSSRPPGAVATVKERWGLAVGLILMITLIAFENLGVATAMPIVARDLGDLSLYGWTFTAPLLASLIGIAVAGREVDRRGPAPPFAVGLLLFSVGLAVAGAAPSMEVLVAGRFVQGLGAGVIPPVAYAAIGRAFTERARATMFALLSTAWVVPGLIGPAVSGTIAERVGWRWVFLAILPLVPVTAILAVPALRRLGAPERPAEEAGAPAPAILGGPIGWSMRLAAGVGLVIGGLGSASLLSVPLVVGGAVLAVPALRALLPAGTLRGAAGVPAAVAARGLQTFTFFGAEAYLPLALNELRGQRATVAGLLLTAATLAWTAGSWAQARRGHRWGRGKFVLSGFVLITIGTALTATVVFEGVPVLVAAAGWTLAGLGMGLSFSGLTLLLLAAAPEGREGASTSALQLSDVLGMALGTGLGGAAVAISDRSGGSPRPGVAAAFGFALVGGIVGCFVARRLARTAPEPAEEAVAVAPL